VLRVISEIAGWGGDAYLPLTWSQPNLPQLQEVGTVLYTLYIYIMISCCSIVVEMVIDIFHSCMYA